MAACSSDEPPTAAAGAPVDAPPSLRVVPETNPGAVYTMSNDLAGNQLVVLRRNLDGTLTPAATLATGGVGSGAFEDAANGMRFTPAAELAAAGYPEHAALITAAAAADDRPASD